MKKQPYILRFSYENKKDGRKTRGWFVKIVNAELVVRKLFSDGRYGSSKKALAAAIEFRNTKLQKVKHETADF
jgi:hypothetical protein